MRNATPMGRLTNTDWTAIGEGGDTPTKLLYELDEKGRVVPKSSPTSPIGDMFSLQEEEEIEWARQQVQRSDYIPQAARKRSSVSSLEAGEAAKAPDRNWKASIDAEQDEEWKKVRQFVEKRPMRRATVGEDSQRDSM